MDLATVLEMILRILPVLSLLLLALSPAKTRADTLEEVNALRLRGCDGRSGVKTALRPVTKLDETARLLSGGAPLAQALAGANYRALNSASVRLTSPSGDSAVARLLEKNFCEEATSAAFREIGIARRDRVTWIVVAAPFEPPSRADARTVSRRVLELVNEARAQSRRCGAKRFAPVPPLKLNRALGRAALAHAQDMARLDHMTHKSRDGSTPAQRVSRSGYSWKNVAENVAAGQMTPEAAVASWIESPGHCANLMSAQFTEMGVAFAVEPDSGPGIYWAQVFAAPR